MRGFFNLTPLLDVLLILLFAFMVQSNSEQKQFRETIVRNKDSYIRALEANVHGLRTEVERSSAALAALKQQRTAMSDALLAQDERYREFQREMEAQAADLAESLARIFDTEKAAFLEFMNDLSEESRKALLNRLSLLSNKNEVVYELLKFDALNNHFHPIELRISNNDLLYVNRKRTTSKAISEDKVKELIVESIYEAQRSSQGIGRILLLWSYGKGATVHGKNVVKRAVDRIYDLYGVDKMIVASGGFIPEGDAYETVDK